jgi:glucosamine-6-phosphate deaminase
MEVIIEANAQEVSRHAARIFRHQLRQKPHSVLGLATGTTPLGLYNELVGLYTLGEIDFSQVTMFNLDEYVGLGPEHPQSYASYMRQHLFSKINVTPGRCHIPDGTATDLAEHCGTYERMISEAGGIDLQLLGIGSDGHIGFNEPSSSLSSRTRLKTLTERTIQDNARFFRSSAEVPRHVITMGVGTIMEARRCLVLATGEKKAGAVAAAVEGPITADVPASILQMHRTCTLIVDEPAAARLRRKDYYRWVYANKPDFQRIPDS